MNKAKELYEEARRVGNVNAIFNLGTLYEAQGGSRGSNPSGSKKRQGLRCSTSTPHTSCVDTTHLGAKANSKDSF